MPIALVSPDIENVVVKWYDEVLRSADVLSFI